MYFRPWLRPDTPFEEFTVLPGSLSWIRGLFLIEGEVETYRIGD